MDTWDIDELLCEDTVPETKDRGQTADSPAETDTYPELIAPEVIFPLGES